MEYFLTENNKGYCVHFASAATLMFRQLGIPARYVEGYYVPASSFNRVNHQFSANVIDSDAHAWVEIFHDVYGWIPVEVTVGYTVDEEQQEDENEDEVVTPQLPTGDENNATNNNQQPNQELPDTPIVDVGKDEQEIPEYVYSMIISLLIFISCVLVYFIRLLLRERSFIQKDNHDSMYSLVNYYHKLCKYQQIDDEQLLSLFEKNKFSRNGCSNDEVKFVRVKLKNKSKEIFKNLSFFKKFKYMIIDCLY